MEPHSRSAIWSLLPSRALLLALALTVGFDDFRQHLTVRFSHSHLLQAASFHTHTELFGMLDQELELPADPSGPGPKKHTHVVRVCEEIPATEVKVASLQILELPCGDESPKLGQVRGPIRYGDPWFRPPCSAGC